MKVPVKGLESSPEGQPEKEATKPKRKPTPKRRASVSKPRKNIDMQAQEEEIGDTITLAQYVDDIEGEGEAEVSKNHVSERGDSDNSCRLLQSRNREGRAWQESRERKRQPQKIPLQRTRTQR